MAEQLDDAGRPAPAWACPGTVVRYRPHFGHDTWYLGQITGKPRLLGGTWVVRVGRMEAAYRNGRGGVAAAALNALEPVAVCETPSATIESGAGPRERGDARIALDRAAAEVES